MGSGPACSVLTEVLSPRDSGAGLLCVAAITASGADPTSLETSRRTRNASVAAQPFPHNDENAAEIGRCARTCAQGAGMALPPATPATGRRGRCARPRARDAAAGRRASS